MYDQLLVTFNEMVAKVVFDWWVAFGAVLFFAALLTLASRFFYLRCDDYEIDDPVFCGALACGGVGAILWLAFIIHCCTFSTILYPGAAVLFRFAR